MKGKCLCPKCKRRREVNFYGINWRAIIAHCFEQKLLSYNYSKSPVILARVKERST